MIKPRIYLSASFAARDEIKHVAEEMTKAGFEVTSNWLIEPPLQVGQEHREWELRARANEDMEDIRRSDLLVEFTQWPSTTGGRYWEAGFAAGLGIPVHVIGDRQCVFDYRAATVVHATFDDFIDWLTDGAAMADAVASDQFALVDEDTEATVEPLRRSGADPAGQSRQGRLGYDLSAVSRQGSA